MAKSVSAFSVLERTSHFSQKNIREFLEGDILVLSDFRINRHACATVLEYPSTRALSNLRSALGRLDVKSVAGLNRLGLAALLNTNGVGERTAWLASMLVNAAGYDVQTWCASGFKTTRAAIADTNRKARKRGKQPVSK